MKSIKILTLMVVALLCSTAVIAQEKCDKSEWTPKKGSVTLGVSLGYNSFNTASAPVVSTPEYTIAAQSNSWINNPLMVGIEGSWFVTNNWALNFGGGLGYTYKPGYATSLGVSSDDGSDPTDIPTYRAVGNASDLRYNVFVGMNHYWHLKQVPNLMFYTGARFGFAYGLNQIKFDEETSMGISLAETFSMRVAGVAGVEYYVAPAFYIGAEVQPVAYSYNVNSMRPQEGLASYSADSHDISFLAAPTIKLGFKF